MSTAYSLERRDAVLKKFLPPHNLTVQQVSEQEGIAVSTLYTWRKNARQKGVAMPSQNNKWSPQDKLNIIVETAPLNDELGQYCREKGLYPEQIEQWKEQAISGFEKKMPKLAPSKEIRKLEREIRRKDKALAETAALLVLQKKWQTLWGDEET